MRYILVNDTRYDYDSEEFDSLAAAVIKAQDIWGHLTRAEKDTHDVYVLDSANPDEEADNHMDGDVVYDAEWEQDCGKDVAITVLGGKTAYVALTQQAYLTNRMGDAIYAANGIRKDTGELVTVYWEITHPEAENEENACDWARADDWEAQ